MSAAVAFGFFCAGLVCGMVLQSAATVEQIAHPEGLWDHLKPDWLKKWAREADSAANEARVWRQREMDTRA